MFDRPTADDFVVINENLGEMIKYVANEPSVGMYFIQQHAQNAVPNLINLVTHVTKKSREATLHTEDLEESIAITRSMKECGFPIIDEMIRDINTSLALVKEGMIQQQTFSYEVGGSNVWVPVTWAKGLLSPHDGEGGGSYFSNVFRYPKGKEGNERFVPRSVSCSQLDSADKLRLRSQVEDEAVGGSSVLPASNEYDEFKADREARLEEWLKDTGSTLEKRPGDAEGQSSA